MNSRACFVVSSLLCFLPALSGCGTFRETFPPRSAVEQLLISSTVDRAVEALPTDWLEGTSVLVDAANLDSYDRPYVLQRVRQMILENGGRLAADRENAEVVLEIASGGLSVDKGSWLLGIPELPLPIPFAGETLKLPELPLFKLDSYVGKGKILFSAVDPSTNGQFRELPVCYGKAHYRLWWAFIVGPFTWSDLPREVR